MRTTGEYLLTFTNPQHRSQVLQWQGALQLGRVTFYLAPWTRFRHASPAKMRYKVRVCLEGVPEHAWDVDSVTPLFDPATIIDGIDSEVRSEQESGCLRLWVWMDDIEKLRTSGCLQLEEPRERGSPDMHFPEIGILEEAPARWGMLGLLGSPVLIHLDHVIDFSTPPDSSSDSHGSDHSDVSGMPSEISSSFAWPSRWGYRWFLGFEDGDFPPPPTRGFVSLMEEREGVGVEMAAAAGAGTEKEGNQDALSTTGGVLLALLVGSTPAAFTAEAGNLLGPR